MAKNIANVVIATDSFASWIGITNQMADAFTKYAMTADSSTNGSSVTGNSQLIGIFHSNTVAINSALRGGNVSTSGNLTITSNAYFSGPFVNATANVYFNNANTTVNTGVFRVIGGLANVQSNVSIINTNTSINTTAFYVVGGLANISSNVSVDNTNTYINTDSFDLNGGSANITSNVSIENSNTYINATAFTIVAVSDFIGNTTFGANSSLDNIVLSTNASASNLQITTTTVGINAITTSTGNVTFKANSTVSSLQITGNGTTSNVTVTANVVTVTGNVSFSNTVNVTGQLTTNVTNTGDLTVTGLVNVSSTMEVSGNTLLSSLSVTGNTQFAANEMLFTSASNTNLLGANTGGVFNPVEILNFPITYGGARITAKSSSAVSINFNALTAVSNTNETITISGHPLKNNDVVTYYVAVGNTAVSGISNGSQYYVINTTSTTVQLSTSPSGAPLNLTASVSETGHTLASNTSQVQELIIAHNGNTLAQDVTLTVYGTVAAPASANLGVFSASINTTAVAVKFGQTRANTSVKLFAQLLK